MTTTLPLRRLGSATFLVALALVVGACDTTDDTALDVLTVDFSIDADDYEVTGLYTAAFSAEDAEVSSGNLSRALRTAGSGDLVMLYIASELVNGFESTNVFWTGLPVTRGFNQVSDDGTEFIDLVASYEYTFADNSLFFNVVSSLPFDAFSDDPEVLFESIIPAEIGRSPDDLFFRLVVIPDELFFVDGQAGARVDLRDYEAVKAAYGLPD